MKKVYLLSAVERVMGIFGENAVDVLTGLC